MGGGGGVKDTPLDIQGLNVGTTLQMYSSKAEKLPHPLGAFLFSKLPTLSPEFLGIETNKSANDQLLNFKKYLSWLHEPHEP